MFLISDSELETGVIMSEGHTHGHGAADCPVKFGPLNMGDPIKESAVFPTLFTLIRM